MTGAKLGPPETDTAGAAVGVKELDSQPPNPITSFIWPFVTMSNLFSITEFMSISVLYEILESQGWKGLWRLGLNVK